MSSGASTKPSLHLRLAGEGLDFCDDITVAQAAAIIGYVEAQTERDKAADVGCTSSSSHLNIGDRVRPSKHARESSLFRTTRLGTVVGFGRAPETIRVKLDGLKTVIRYHQSFWDRN